MTLTDLHQLPWRMQSHLALVDEHVTVYAAEVQGIKIAKCVHTKRENYYLLGRSYTHYVIDNDDKVYKTHRAALNRINTLLND